MIFAKNYGMKNIHIGTLIENRRKELGVSKVEVAKRMKTSRQNIALIVQRSSIQCNQLQRFCVAMDHDFFQYYNGISTEEHRQIATQLSETRNAFGEGQKTIAAHQEDIGRLQKENEALKLALELMSGRK